MKRLFAATTALALMGGAAFAEISISGDAKLGLNYNSEPDDMKSKHSFTHEMGVDFTGSGTTDGGLSFGGKAGFDTGDDKVNTGNVWISGSFGKLTIGDNDAADLLAGGIADVGLDGQGVDDVAEDIRGTSAAQFRYDQSVGSIALAISAGTSDGKMGMPAVSDDEMGNFEVKKNSYAIGMNFSASGATVGLGYDSKKTISAGLGYSTGQISASAFYAKRDQPYAHYGSPSSSAGPTKGDDASTDTQLADGTFDAGMTGLGVDVSYTMGASTLTLVYTKTDLDNIQPVWTTGAGAEDGVTGAATDKVTFSSASFKGIGLGFSHDLGGGAKLVAGFGQVPKMEVGKLGPAHIGQTLDGADDDSTTGADDRYDLTAKKNVASVGLSFAF